MLTLTDYFVEKISPRNFTNFFNIRDYLCSFMLKNLKIMFSDTKSLSQEKLIINENARRTTYSYIQY
jgi:hypothetical protein